MLHFILSCSSEVIGEAGLIDFGTVHSRCAKGCLGAPLVDGITHLLYISGGVARIAGIFRGLGNGFEELPGEGAEKNFILREKRNGSVPGAQRPISLKRTRRNIHMPKKKAAGEFAAFNFIDLIDSPPAAAAAASVATTSTTAAS